VLARLKTPLAGLLRAAANGTLAAFPALRWSEGAAVTVVIASHNYPDTPRTGDPITGLEAVAEKDEHAYVLHAGTKLDADGRIVSAGGRVLSVTATGSHLGKARERAYRAVERITLDGSHHRTDIAAKVATAAEDAAAHPTA
jgi:phosphoribosylamine--glycine ligase